MYFFLLQVSGFMSITYDASIVISGQIFITNCYHFIRTIFDKSQLIKMRYAVYKKCLS